MPATDKLKRTMWVRYVPSFWRTMFPWWPRKPIDITLAMVENGNRMRLRDVIPGDLPLDWQVVHVVEKPDNVIVDLLGAE